MKADKFIENARSYLVRSDGLPGGVRWVHAGRNREVGVDCTGLVILSLNAAGAKIPEIYDYSRFDEFVRLIRIVNEYCDKKENATWKDLEKGDLIIFRAKDMDNHIAIYSEEGTIIHSFSSPAVMQVVEEPLTGYWKTKIHSVYRYKGMD